MAELGADTAPSARQDCAVFSAATERGSAAGAALEQDGSSSGHLTDAPANLELATHALQDRRKSPRCTHWCFKSFVLAVILLSCLSIALTGFTVGRTQQGDSSAAPESIFTKRLAFSSCTQRHMGENEIWEKAIIPAKPDVWVWMGDLAYMDIPAVDCYSKENHEHPDCNCSPTVLRHPSHGCKSGDEQNARRKANAITHGAGYSAFLEFMCPMHLRTGSYPPPGADPAACPRAIYGVYDDHDFSWNDGNGYQLAQKSLLKQVFLDAIGEAAGSSRRLGDRGIYEHRVLNRGHRGKDIDLVLLDERYERVPLPCHTRADFCQPSVAKSASRVVWCDDFLGLGNITRPASCCRKDDDVMREWCARSDAKGDARYSAACDPWSHEFGATNWVVGADGELAVANPTRWQDVQDESSFCEVLGKKQRDWLNSTLEHASAAVMLLGSGSVLLGHPGKENAATDKPPYTGGCSGDDWDCYKPAQQNLLGMLARRLRKQGAGCVVVMTGDYHHADIKRVAPGEGSLYNEFLEPPGLSRPIWQIMASGMDPSTARGLDTSCGDPCCSWWRDEAGLRGPGKACHVFGDPNFGTIDLDFDKRVISLSIFSGATGTIAVAADGGLMQVNVSMDTCEAEQ